MNSRTQDAVQTGYTKRHGLPAWRSLQRHAHGAEQCRVGVEPERVFLPIPAPTLRVVLVSFFCGFYISIMIVASNLKKEPFSVIF